MTRALDPVACYRRVKLCAWCDAVFVGRREDFCQRACGDAWRKAEARRKRLSRERVLRRMRAAARLRCASMRDIRRAAA